MKIRAMIVAVTAAFALSATSLALAGEPAPRPTQSQPAQRGQAVLEELAAGMRDVLRAVVPEIALPQIDVKLPALVSRSR